MGVARTFQGLHSVRRWTPTILYKNLQLANPEVDNPTSTFSRMVRKQIFENAENSKSAHCALPGLGG
jgi:hypothetical protein